MENHQIKVVGEDVPRFGGDCMSEGLVLIHRAPSSLLTHVEWTISGISGNPSKINWIKGESSDSIFRGSVLVDFDLKDGATLASALSLIHI